MSEPAPAPAPSPGLAGDPAPSPAPSPAPTPSPAPGGGADSWRAALPPELSTVPSLTKFNDVTSLAKSYTELEKALSVPKLAMPNDQWTAKEWGELHGKLGRPEKPEGYEFKPLENLPKELSYTPENDKWFAENAHKLGLSKAQAGPLRDAFVAFQMEQAKGIQTKNAEATALNEKALVDLQTKFGPEWNASVDGARKVIAEFGGPEMKTFLTEKGLANDPTMINFMIKVAGAMKDHSVITGTPRFAGSFDGGPAAASSEITRLKTDVEFQKSLTDARHPQHDANLAKWQGLFRAKQTQGA